MSLALVSVFQSVYGLEAAATEKSCWFWKDGSELSGEGEEGRGEAFLAIKNARRDCKLTM